MSDMPWRSLRAAARIVERRKLDVSVEGLEHVPPRGPAMIAARHYHHLYDGCVLLSAIRRPAHILVAGDWVPAGPARAIFDRACAAARWPVVERPDGPRAVNVQTAARAFLQASRETTQLFSEGRVLLVFPEGYPNIDPGYTPKSDTEETLPFQPGFVRLAKFAQRDGLRIPIVPAGLTYVHNDRWTVAVRFGTPMHFNLDDDEAMFVAKLESDVHSLCRSAIT